MDARTLTPAEFRHFIGRSLQSFLEDWAACRSNDPEVFGEAMSAQDWMELFSEFVAAEIVNQPHRALLAADVMGIRLAACLPNA